MRVSIEPRDATPAGSDEPPRTRWGIWAQQGSGRRVKRWFPTELEAIRHAQTRGWEVQGDQLFAYSDEELGYRETDPSTGCQLGFGFATGGEGVELD